MSVAKEKEYFFLRIKTLFKAFSLPEMETKGLIQ